MHSCPVLNPNYNITSTFFHFAFLLLLFRNKTPFYSYSNKIAHNRVKQDNFILANIPQFLELCKYTLFAVRTEPRPAVASSGATILAPCRRLLARPRATALLSLHSPHPLLLVLDDSFGLISSPNQLAYHAFGHGSGAVTARAVTAAGTWAPRSMGPHVSSSYCTCSNCTGSPSHAFSLVLFFFLVPETNWPSFLGLPSKSLASVPPSSNRRQPWPPNLPFYLPRPPLAHLHSSWRWGFKIPWQPFSTAQA